MLRAAHVMRVGPGCRSEAILHSHLHSLLDLTALTANVLLFDAMKSLADFEVHADGPQSCTQSEYEGFKDGLRHG